MYENEAFLKTKFMAYDTVLRPRNCGAPEWLFLPTLLGVIFQVVLNVFPFHHTRWCRSK